MNSTPPPPHRPRSTPALRRLLANREIALTLERVRAAGASAEYVSVDIRDAEQVGRVLDEVRARCGPVRALVHAAGVLEDRLILDKTAEQFRRVYDTKVRGFRALMRALPAEELRYLIVFSSVTARIGNKGQADYAMANEALNKLAAAHAAAHPECRVLSVNWGPWDGGMVTPSLKREFARQGVALLPIDSGTNALIREMAGEPGGPVEVVIGGMLAGSPAQPPAEAPRPALSILYEREIDLRTHPVLASHVIDGKAVVPLALMAEWFAHAALHENPGLLLQGLEDMRVLNGIRLKEDSKLIRLFAGKARRRQGVYEVDLELRNGVREGKDILHSRARAILADGYAPAAGLPAAREPLLQPLPALGGRDLREDSLPRATAARLAHGAVLQCRRHGGRSRGGAGAVSLDRLPPAELLAVRPARARLRLPDGERVVLRAARLRVAAQPRRVLPAVPHRLPGRRRGRGARSHRRHGQAHARGLHLPGRLAAR